MLDKIKAKVREVRADYRASQEHLARMKPALDKAHRAAQERRRQVPPHIAYRMSDDEIRTYLRGRR